MNSIDNRTHEFRRLFSDLQQAKGNVRDRLVSHPHGKPFSEGIGGRIYVARPLPLHFLATTRQIADTDYIHIHFFEQSRDNEHYSFDPDNTSTYEISEAGVLVSRFSPEAGLSIRALAKQRDVTLPEFDLKDSMQLMFYRAAIGKEVLNAITPPTSELNAINESLRASTSHGIAFCYHPDKPSPDPQYGLHMPQTDLERIDFADIHI